MRYADLIQFEPIESVIQLLDANRPEEADKLVSTYVISDDMAERIDIKQLMERSDESTYVTGHLIWQYPLEWQERRVERNGYLFFGAPNDRPTAQPDRDFYIYFIQPFDPPRFHDEHLADEVFFRLKGLDDEIKRHLAFYAAALELASTAGGGAKKIYLDKSQDALRAMSKWLREKQMTAFEVTCQGRTKTLQNWVKGVSLRDKARLGPEERINFRDVVNIVSGLALSQRFAETAPEYPSFAVLVTEVNRRQLVGGALRALAGGLRTKDATALLDGLELLDGDRIEPSRSRYAQEVLNRLKAKGPGQVLNRGELLEGPTEVEYFAPARFRLEPDLLVVVLAGLVYAGDIVLAVTGDKIDSGKLARLAECSLDELKQFKHLEAPREINVAVLRALFELLDPQAPSGLAQLAAQGSEEPVKRLQEAVTRLVRRVLAAGADLQGRLTFWSQSLRRDEEIRDWRVRLEALKTFTESLSPYNTVGKLKNLRIGLDDIEAQKHNLEVLATVETLLALVGELGSAASYLSQAEMALPGDHAWVKQAQAVRRTMLEQLSQDRTGRHAAEYRRTLAQLKKSYVAAYIAEHGKARLGVAEDKTKMALRKDARLASLRTLAGVSLMPTRQLAAFESRLDSLKSCFQLSNPELNASPICPHCGYKPANESLPFGPVANALTQLDEELDRLLAGWRRTLLDNLAEPSIRAKFDLLKTSARDLIQSFVASQTLPDPVTPAFVGAAQEALSGLEKIAVTGEDIRQALLAGGSPATSEELRRRFETFLTERCKGKEAGKLRFIIE